MTDQRSTDRPTGSMAPRAGRASDRTSLRFSLRRATRPEAGSLSAETAGLVSTAATLAIGGCAYAVEVLLPTIEPALRAVVVALEVVL